MTKTVIAAVRLNCSRRHLARPPAHCTTGITQFSRVAIIIPVLREQNSISDTLDHLRSLPRPVGLAVDIYVVGTARERTERQVRRPLALALFAVFQRCESLQDAQALMIGHFTRSKVTALWERRARISEADLAFAYDKEPTTLDVVAAWCAEAGAMDHFVVHCIESPDTHGTRARQVNLALQLARGAVEPPDYVGIYDADSRPDPDTLIEIASLFEGVTEMCVQQPLRYTSAAAALARERRSPVLVANALYQTTWSLIKEVPNLLAYSDRSHDRPYKKSLYLNGHGEFFTRPLIAKVGGVPEDAIADGIQIGYRLALAGESISVTQTFCDDDVPSSHTALLKQHMRWYAGNLEFWGAWRGTVRKHGWHRYRAPAIDNVLLNVTWALRPWVYGAALGVAAFGPAPFRPLILAVLLGAGAVYAYLLPLIALRLTRQRPRLRLRDWAALPIAIAFKSLGANAVLARHIVAWFCHQRGFAWHKVER